MGPCGLGGQELGGHSFQSSRHTETEPIIHTGLGVVDGAVQHSVNACAGRFDAHALALTAGPSRPAGVDEEDMRAVFLEFLPQQVSVLDTPRQRNKKLKTWLLTLIIP